MAAQKEIGVVAKNDVTGDSLRSKTQTEAYAKGWDAIFGKKPNLVIMDEIFEEKSSKNCENRCLHSEASGV